MKRIKFPFAASVAICAAIGALSSAFVSHTATEYTFYRVSGSSTSTTRTDYKFKTALQSPGCGTSIPLSYCSAIWSQVTVPTANSIPSSTAVLITIGNNVSPHTGIYNGN